MTPIRRTLDRNRVTTLLEKRELTRLFRTELGWDQCRAELTVPVTGREYVLTAIAEKRGMVAWQWVGVQPDDMPDSATRQKIERAVTKRVHEHIIVYTPHGQGVQYWQWVRREPGQPERSRFHEYNRAGSAESLIQKLEQVAFSLDEEGDLTIVDVSERVRAAFDVERVTKSFYDRFVKEHELFRSFIEGLQNKMDRDWYTSLMLNRMMFIYFIQKRGFLDDDTQYLQNRLRMVRQSQGQDEFHTFYRVFLLRLFHEGLGQPKDRRSHNLVRLLGDVPYLNGGLFDVHQLERDSSSIRIPDEAFARIFRFFESYQWHLDDRSRRSDNDINPDVLGYIFEKYINQKEKGAYYTKEDVTGYIGRHTIIPFLFDRARTLLPGAFRRGGPVWSLLADNPERYIYKAVRHGTEHELPAQIADGIGGPASSRRYWNDPAPAKYGLPTETYREHIARRQRYEVLRGRIALGQVTTINQVVTDNLDVETFIVDVIRRSDTAELVHAFWTAATELSVLDPTCGSGAFLFASVNILRPIYDACLDSMQGFVDDERQDDERRQCTRLADFHSILRDMKTHPSAGYYIHKTIVLNNLYGVDIMAEAVEICKLRLFLKLVSELDSVDQIEPLPDIDFNIRTGNALVGFASLDDVRTVLARDFISELDLPEIDKQARKTSRAFGRFRHMQIKTALDADEFTAAKIELREQLVSLRDQLDRFLARRYGLADKKEPEYEAWRASHLPFHWCVEFHGIMEQGGFDVVIGNPPYLRASIAKKSYAVLETDCTACPDIYAWVLERNTRLLGNDGRTGMIAPLSLGFSSRFGSIRRLLCSRYDHNWFSHFGRIPSQLFSHDVRVRNTIHLGCKSEDTDGRGFYTTRLHRWNQVARPILFNTLVYVPFNPVVWKHRVPKLNTNALGIALERLLTEPASRTLADSLATQPTSYALHYAGTAYNWLTTCRERPPCYGSDGREVEHAAYGRLYCRGATGRTLAMLLANGKLMLVYWFVIGDDFHVARWNIAEFPVNILDLLTHENVAQLLEISDELEKAMRANIVYKKNAGKKSGNYNLAKCRDITDRSDRLLAQVLGLGDVWEDIELYCAQTIRRNEA